MKIFAVDSNNDLYIGGNGQLAINTGLAAVIQACEHAAKAQLGEMFLAVNRGIPNFQVVWNGNPNLGQFQAALRKALLGVTEVTDVESLDIGLSNNTLFYAAVIKTIYGEGTLNG